MNLLSQTIARQQTVNGDIGITEYHNPQNSSSYYHHHSSKTTLQVIINKDLLSQIVSPIKGAEGRCVNTNGAKPLLLYYIKLGKGFCQF